ncbi:HD domain-containing phosphohydrolase [Methylomarinum vadi]|uniref:HD domain-containing phosphohydrolase n=1 Tax=Methylomarinum vadi TaxID=438855 RepID=UPI0004DECEAE|nr:HD domain-containing phosphohydrolase [Methylomarinum vadi]
MANLFKHTDRLETLNKKLPLSDKLNNIRSTLIKQHPFIDRIAIAVYDPGTDMLKTLTYSSDEPSPLTHYQARLQDATSLCEILREGKPRVVNDLSIFDNSTHEYAQKLSRHGFGSSYTHPIIHDDQFYGFIFFNSFRKQVFSDHVLTELDMFSHLIMLLVVNEWSNINTLTATIRSALSLTHYRDPETGGHIARMSHYARLIATELADDYGFDDQFIEHIFLFSPLHDLGKIGIPDKILLKPGRLTDEEYEIMKSHARKGREMIDDLLNNYHLERFQNIDILRNIAEYHHEAYDGSGYPAGLKADEIPIEARIVAVADVFDALTSKRPYKNAWSIADAFDTLLHLADHHLDRECVEALIKHRSDIEQIQQTFQEDIYG